MYGLAGNKAELLRWTWNISVYRAICES